VKTKEYKLLKKLYDECPTEMVCDDFHHMCKDHHEVNEECKPLKRYNEVMNEIEKYLYGRK
jgi:hypothetical protein